MDLGELFQQQLKQAVAERERVEQELGGEKHPASLTT